MAQPDREAFKHAIFIEEAHHVLLRKKQEATGEEMVTDIILREIRELGEAIICLDQHPSLISKPALGNTYTTFAFNLKHRGDMAMMQDCLLLDSEQTDYLGRLEVGWAVAKLQGRWFWPFLVRLPLVRIDKGRVSDQMIRERANLLPTPSPSEPSHQETHSAPIPASAADSRQDATQDDVKTTIPEKEKRDEGIRGDECAIRLTTQERKFLMDVQERPTSFVVDRYSRLGLSARKGNELQRVLIERGLVESASISLHGGTAKILGLTGEGRQALGLPNAASNRNGGPVHTYWKRRLAEHLRARGYEVAEEFPVGSGKTIDLVATRGGKRVAFEIETGASDAAANVRKCLAAGVDSVIVVATSARNRESLAKKLESCPGTIILTATEATKRLAAQ
jgi:Holliday junction resolvase